MAVKLRLVRMGKKKQPTYRIVAAESRRARSGAFLEIVGTYQPRGLSIAEPDTVTKIDNDKVVRWLDRAPSRPSASPSCSRPAAPSTVRGRQGRRPRSERRQTTTSPATSTPSTTATTTTTSTRTSTRTATPPTNAAHGDRGA